MRLRRRRPFGLGSFGLPDHTAAEFFGRMWSTGESIRHEEDTDELEQIAERFYLKGLTDVCDFLRKNQSLIPVLIQVRQKFDEYFDTNDRLSAKLEIFTDPEDFENAPKLFAFVCTALPFSDASSRLERLQEEWWFDQSDETIHLMNIGVEYVDAPV